MYGDINDAAELISAVIAGATLSILFRQHQLETNKARRDLFDSFNRRFDKMNEDLGAICEGNEPVSGKSTQTVVQDYLNLCSEEYLAAYEGLVSERVWKSWKAGINYYMKFHPIARVFLAERNNAPDSYYGILIV